MACYVLLCLLFAASARAPCAPRMRKWTRARNKDASSLRIAPAGLWAGRRATSA